MSEQRSAVLYRCGPGWDRSKPLGEQEVIQQHLAFMGRLIGEGTIEQAGPFYHADELVQGDLIGLALYAVGVEEAARIAAEDPAVAGGFMELDVRPWYP